MAEEDTLDTAEHLELDEDDIGNVEPFGTTELSMPDREFEVKAIDHAASMVREGVDRERKFYQDVESSIRVNTNKSGTVIFGRYTVPAGNQPIMICKEKRDRGDTVITCYTADATVSIGKHGGISPLGLDTVAIVGNVNGAARTIRTRTELWAVATVACDIDVQEEFD